MKLSIIIPAYNEESVLRSSLQKTKDYFKQKKYSYEIIVIDDGSEDKTRKIAEEEKAVLNKKRTNKGKGYSVKEGVRLAKGDYILYMDADMSTPLEELKIFLQYIKKYDIVIASRKTPDSLVKTRFYKKILGRISHLPIKLLLVNDIKDTQCGFKLFKKEVAKRLFKMQKIMRWGFDFEILFLAQKNGYVIKEKGVRWVEDKNSKVKLIDYPKTMIELFKIKYYDYKGYYDTKN